MSEIDQEEFDMFAEEFSQRYSRILEDLEFLEDVSHGCQPDQELAGRLFRETHSLKAAANLLTLRPVELIASKLEDILDVMRSNQNLFLDEGAEGIRYGFDRINQLMNHPHLLKMVDVSRDLRILEDHLLKITKEISNP